MKSLVIFAFCTEGPSGPCSLGCPALKNVTAVYLRRDNLTGFHSVAHSVDILYPSLS